LEFKNIKDEVKPNTLQDKLDFSENTHYPIVQAPQVLMTDTKAQR